MENSNVFTSVDNIFKVSDFLGSIGINVNVTHGVGGYRDVQILRASLDYLGAKSIREALVMDGATQQSVTDLAAAGYKFDLLIPTLTGTDAASGLSQRLDVASAYNTKIPGSIIAIEGPNEVNSQLVNFQGSTSLASAAHFQETLSAAVHADADLNGVAVYNLSVVHSSAADYAAIGDLSASVDFANAHVYASTDLAPYSQIDHLATAAQLDAHGRPVVITETGYTTSAATNTYSSMNEAAEAKYIVSTLLDAFSLGVEKTYLYELLDSGTDAAGTDSEMHFGLFNADGTPKQAATAVHNLTTILGAADSASGTAGAAFKVTAAGMPPSGHQLVLEKSGGTKDVVLWAEPQIWNSTTQTAVAVASQQVRVHLNEAYGTIKVFDPLVGTDPIAVYHNLSDITVNISDHALIIEVSPDFVPTSGTVTGTAAEIAERLDVLQAMSELTSIVLTDTHVLPVSSVAAMRDIIAKDGTALAAIQGGYSFATTVTGTNCNIVTSFDASGVQTSKLTQYFVNNVLSSEVTTYPDGSSHSIWYKAGVQVKEAFVHTDQTRDEYLTGITNASYVGEHDRYDANGKLVAIQRLHADGTPDYQWILNSDGSVSATRYDATGVISSRFSQAADGSTDTIWYTRGIQVKEYKTSPDGSNTTSLFVAGEKVSETVVHADRSQDQYRFGITGQTYTIEHIGIDASGKQVLIERDHADGSLDYIWQLSADGTQTSARYDSSGTKVSTFTLAADGTSTTVWLSQGVKVHDLVVAPSGARAETYYGITGQAYVSEQKTYDSAGKLTGIVQLHADGTPSFTWAVEADGSIHASRFDSAGAKLSEYTEVPGGSADTIWYTAGAKAHELVVSATGERVETYYGISGHSYVTEQKSYDNTGKVVDILQLRADGSTDYRWSLHSDGSIAAIRYAADGTLASQFTQATDGSTDTLKYVNGLKDSETIRHADNTLTTITYTAGVQTLLVEGHANGSRDEYQTAITGKTYVSEHRTYNASQVMVGLEDIRADGTKDYTWSLKTDGSTDAVRYDASGKIASEYIVKTDGTTDATWYSAGTKTSEQIIHADHSRDQFTFGVKGQTYTTQHDIYDSTGRLASTIGTDDAGHLTYQFDASADGSQHAVRYDTAGLKLSEFFKGSDGSTDTITFVNGARTQEVVRHADGSRDEFTVKSNGYIVHDSFDTANHLLVDDTARPDGSHNIVVCRTGVTVASTIGKDDFTSAGGDTFVFADHIGKDTISSFHADAGATHDVIQLNSRLVPDYAHLNIAAVGADVVITLGANDSITLKNVALSHITSDDFHFV